MPRKRRLPKVRLVLPEGASHLDESMIVHLLAYGPLDALGSSAEGFRLWRARRMAVWRAGGSRLPTAARVFDGLTDAGRQYFWAKKYYVNVAPYVPEGLRLLEADRDALHDFAAREGAAVRGVVRRWAAALDDVERAAELMAVRADVVEYLGEISQLVA